MTKDSEHKLNQRSFSLNTRALDDAGDGELVIDFSFASASEEVERMDWVSGQRYVEVLSMTPADVDLKRINEAGVLLLNHERGGWSKLVSPVLGKTFDARIENGVARAKAKLSKREEIRGIVQDIREGIMTNVSVSYAVNSKSLIREAGNGTLPVYSVNWTPFEISVVDVPADSSVGIGRSKYDDTKEEGSSINNNTNNTAKMPEEQKLTPDTSTARALEEKVIVDNARKQFMAEEKSRISDIDNLFGRFGQFSELKSECIVAQKSVDESRKLLLDQLGKDATPCQGVRIDVQDDSEKFRKALETEIAVRSGVSDEKDRLVNTGLRSHSMTEMARLCLERAGERSGNLSKMELVSRAFTHSTSDFPLVLANVANKSLLKGFSAVPNTFQPFVSEAELQDYKIKSLVDITGIADLEKVSEGGEYKNTTVGERGEVYKLDDYGNMISITRQAIINDDLGAFTRALSKLGAKASRKLGDIVYNILLNNPLMGDGNALFSVPHKNLDAVAAAISIDSINKGMVAMRTQTEAGSTDPLGVSAAFIVTGVRNEMVARKVLHSTTTLGQDNPAVINPYQNRLGIIVDERIDAAAGAGAMPWFLVASPVIYDTIELGYLAGESTPILESKEGWRVDGIEYKVRMTAAAKALAWQTFYKNPGVV